MGRETRGILYLRQDLSHLAREGGLAEGHIPSEDSIWGLSTQYVLGSSVTTCSAASGISTDVTLDSQASASEPVNNNLTIPLKFKCPILVPNPDRAEYNHGRVAGDVARAPVNIFLTHPSLPSALQPSDVLLC